MAETHVVLADLHVPFEEEAALAVAVKVAKAAKPDVIWLLGDMIDFAPISRFRDSARYDHTVQDEIDEVIDYFKRLRRTFPNTTIEYMMGNHDRRLKYHLWNNRAELKHLRMARFERQFLLDEDDKPLNLNINFRRGKYHLAPKFILKHGSRYGLYAARWEEDDEGRSGMSGHNHRTVVWSWRTPGGGVTNWYSIGCLCGLDPPYLEDDGKPTHWNHGMAVLTKHGSKVGVENIVIEKGTAIWRGRSFVA